jgi:Trk K+ transport system NAD-binding subunit
VKFDLPGGRQLTMGSVSEESPLVGKTIAELYRRLQPHELEVVVVMRREHLLLPHGNTLLEASDRLVFIASPRAREELAKITTPVSEDEGKGMQATEKILRECRRLKKEWREYSS